MVLNKFLNKAHKIRVLFGLANLLQQFLKLLRFKQRLLFFHDMNICINTIKMLWLLQFKVLTWRSNE